MQWLLGKPGKGRLRALASERVLLAFDYDGTLAPFAVAVEEARMRPSTARLFAKLCRRYPCSIVSGRSRADLASLVGDVRPLELLGNHGMEPRKAHPELAGWLAAVKRWKRILQPRLRGLEGVFLEDKRLSLCIHYRGVRDAVLVAKAVRTASRDLEGARHVRGKLLLNLVPAGAPNKGAALLQTMAEHGCDHALFVGDDVTDEDAFRLSARHPVLGVRVGRWQRSRAAYFVKDQAEVDALLEVLLLARASARRLPGG